MTKRKPFLLRMDATIFGALHKWADDELRSLNGQLEYLLREALRKSGRLPRRTNPPEGTRADDRD